MENVLQATYVKHHSSWEFTHISPDDYWKGFTVYDL